MANKEEMVPGEDFMTLIMGLGDPEEPGPHGREKVMGMPHETCCEFIATIRDMCEEFLRNAGKDSEDKKEEKDSSDEEMDEEE